MDNIQLPPYLARIAEEELGETEESRRECIPKLRKMLQHQLGLVGMNEELGFLELGQEMRDKISDDLFLLRFLRVSKFNVAKAFDRVKSYYEVRKRYKPDLDKTNIFEVISILDLKVLQVLPSKTKEHYSIIYGSAENFNLKCFDVENAFRAIIFSAEKNIERDHEFQIVGTRIVINMKDYEIRHLMRLTPNFLYKCVACVLKITPMRIVSIHIVNLPKIFQVALKLAMSLIPSKLRARLVIHGSDLESLYEYVEASVLPPQLGGRGAEMDVEGWIKNELKTEKSRNAGKRCLEEVNFDPDVDYSSDPNKNYPNYWIQKYYHVIKD